MAQGSEQVSFKKYGQNGRNPKCTGCGRKLSKNEPLWFVGTPTKAVYGRCCNAQAAKHGS